jgi:hypothetical protein
LLAAVRPLILDSSSVSATSVVKIRGLSTVPSKGFPASKLAANFASFEQAEKIKALADFDARMKAKYEAAVRLPWLPVEPDPPRPELPEPE